MPNKVTRYTAWERLQARYQLEPIGQIVGKSLADEIVPITNIDTTLLTPTLRADTLDLSVTAGTLVIAATVPAGERWRMIWFHRNATASNASIFCTVGGVSGQLTNTNTGATSDHIPITLLEGDVYGMRASGNVGDDSEDLIAVFEVEEV